MQDILKKYYVNIQLSGDASLLTSSSHCVSIKNSEGIYHYANTYFIQLMGRKNLKQVVSKQDKELTANRKLLHTIAEHDSRILEEEQPFAVQDVIYPLAVPWLKKEVKGHLYPVYSEEKSKPIGILGAFQPVNKLLVISLEAIARLSLHDFRHLLRQRSYQITWQGLHFRLSRQEILVIIAIVKGGQAGDIASSLGVTQHTIESYSQNIKNKLGIQSRREIITAVLETSLLKQVFI